MKNKKDFNKFRQTEVTVVFKKGCSHDNTLKLLQHKTNVHTT